jgi:DNA-binding PadR family transcriptional regulator
VFPQRDLQRGSAELLVLGILRERAMYGYEIVRELRDRSEGYFDMEEGLLYPTLHRLEREGLVRAEWRIVARRRRRYYALTEAGRQAAVSAAAAWREFLHRLLGVISTGGAERVGAQPNPA